MLKKLLKIVLILIVLLAIGAGYVYFRLHNDIDNILEANHDWRSEVLEFPLLFAGDLDYEGEEHIRFAPGWGEVNSEDYFSYVFVWVLKEDPKLNEQTLEDVMNIYFDGLMNTGAITNFRFFKDIPKTESSFRKTEEDHFQGTITMYDEFFSKDLVTLQAKVRYEYCLARERHLVWFYLSPKERDHSIWDQLKAVHLNVGCN